MNLAKPSIQNSETVCVALITHLTAIRQQNRLPPQNVTARTLEPKNIRTIIASFDMVVLTCCNLNAVAPLLGGLENLHYCHPASLNTGFNF